MMKRFFCLLALVCTIAVVSGCANVKKRVDLANKVAKKAGFKHMQVNTDIFKITSFYSITDPNKPVNFYIEGDGLAWVTPSQVSGNPTPTDPLALGLAVRDPAPNVVYIARPCQYTDFNDDRDCHPRYWTSSRFSKKVVDSIAQVIDHYKGQLKSANINLVGYSGGGAVATILAAIREDVSSLRTVAGNLDHDAVNKYHDVDLLTDSLNPIDFADMLSEIPQHHFVGVDDSIIPVSVSRSFAQRVEKGKKCVKVSSLNGVNHHKGWYENWEYLLDQPISCLN